MLHEESGRAGADNVFGIGRRALSPKPEIFSSLLRKVGKLMLMMLSGSLRSPLTKQKRSQTDADDVVWFPSQQSTMQKRSPLMPMMLSGRACSTHATEKHRRTDADDVGLLAGEVLMHLLSWSAIACVWPLGPGERNNRAVLPCNA